MTDRTRARDLGWYAGAVLVGAALLVVAAVKQPFSYDELTQIRPYATGSVSDIVHATRQPPLAPLIEAGIARLLGQGQLQQRLLPVLSGIGCLVVMGLLLRRLGLRRTGAVVLLLMATTPLLVRYGAYTRPYAFPAFVMLLVAWAVQGWIDERRARWLVTAAAGALALPMIRVPEPMAFLATTVLTLAVFWWRGRLTRAQALPPMVVVALSLLTTGLIAYRGLEQSSGTVADLRPGSMAERFGTGLHELVTNVPQVLAHAFPWWPVTLLLLVAVLAHGPARRRLLGWWMVWPLLAGPVAFALAYHFGSTLSFDALPYRDRFATFFIAPLFLALAALLSTLPSQWWRRERRTQVVAGGVALLAGLLLVTQLPRTYAVLTTDAAPDFALMSRVLTSTVPDDAIVLYDRTTPAGASRQPFLGTYRYMGATPFTATVAKIPDQVDSLPTSGPVYLLFNGQCAYAGRCVPGRSHAVTVTIPGWHVAYRHDRFTLYAPDDPATASGRAGVARAMTASGGALGTDLGYVQTYAAAAVLDAEGRAAEGRALLARLHASVGDDEWARMQAEVDLYHLDPFTTTDHR